MWRVVAIPYGKFGSIPLVKTSKLSKRSLDHKPRTEQVMLCYLSHADRRKARPLQGIKSADLFTNSPGQVTSLRTMWKLCRMFPTKLLEVDVADTIEKTFPGWLTFLNLSANCDSV